MLKNPKKSKRYVPEFNCPNLCDSPLVYKLQKAEDKERIRYICGSCGAGTLNFIKIKTRKPIQDPINESVIWYSHHKYQELCCLDCNTALDVDERNTIKFHKVYFHCKKCARYLLPSSLDIKDPRNANYMNPMVTSFIFESDKWDLRSINPKEEKIIDTRFLYLDFSEIDSDWYKNVVKKYAQHICKQGIAYSTVYGKINDLKRFYWFLKERGINHFESISRKEILLFLSKQEKVHKVLLGNLKTFFDTGNIKKWFNIERDLIRKEDYPKQRKKNPDPLSDVVFNEIVSNLNKLPKPIARMWIVSFFCALRPSELIYLKQDCLVQEGDKWSVVWKRPKSKDQHSIFISRSVAKIIQEQQEYIKTLWGNEWQYLFCHYHGASENFSKIDLKPVKRLVLRTSGNILSTCIRALIKKFQIKDENGKLAKFKPQILRPSRLTKLFEQGFDLAVISSYAGHKNFATTSLYYTKISNELMGKETLHLQLAMLNKEGKPLLYESLPKTFWQNPQAHKLELSGDHINTPIYGACGLPLDQECEKFGACYPCNNFVPTSDKLPQYKKVRDELYRKKDRAKADGHDLLFEKYELQLTHLEAIIKTFET